MQSFFPRRPAAALWRVAPNKIRSNPPGEQEGARWLYPDQNRGIGKRTICGQNWLCYFYEYEAISNSGRWYRVLVTHDEAAAVTTRTAVSLLCGRLWDFRGGSYFQTAGRRCDWQLDPDVL